MDQNKKNKMNKTIINARLNGTLKYIINSNEPLTILSRGLLKMFKTFYTSEINNYQVEINVINELIDIYNNMQNKTKEDDKMFTYSVFLIEAYGYRQSRYQYILDKIDKRLKDEEKK